MSVRAARADLLEQLAAFAALLRADGVAIAVEQIGDAAAALAALEPARAREGYWALRCTLVGRREDLAPFDRAFARFWGPPPIELVTSRQPFDAGGDGAPPGEPVPEPVRAAAHGDDASTGEDPSARRVSVSARERLRTLDFSAYAPDELRRARRAMERLAHGLPRRRERRLEPSRAGRRLDTRRTLVAALRTDGVPLRRAWRAPRRRPFKLVLVLDVSGSMQAYARALLTFAHAAVRADRRVEAFTFGTRLTRVTRQLAERHPDRALAGVARAVPDWSSGTRIGENLRALNERWGRRGVTRGAIVVILSDGCERGEPTLLADQLATLRRCARRIVWVNPLAGHAGYEPLAAGMAAALPQLDRLLAGHDLAALETLVDVVCSLDAGRDPRPAPAVPSASICKY